MDESTISYILYFCCVSIFGLSFLLFYQFKGIGLRGAGTSLRLIVFSFVMFPIIGFYVILLGALYFSKKSFLIIIPFIIFHLIYVKYSLLPSLEEEQEVKKKK